MSDNSSEKEGEPCVICQKVNKSKAKRYACHRCKKIYHSTCITLRTVLDGKEKVLVCNPCITEVNSPTPLPRGSTSSSRSVGEANDVVDESTLGLILKQLKKLDGLVESNKATEVKIDELRDSFESRFQELQSQMSVLDQLPSLFERVAQNEQKISEIIVEQEAMRSLIEARNDADALLDGNMLRRVEEDLNRKINRLSMKQAQLTQEVIISGLHHEEGMDLRILSLAVLKAVYSEIQQRDIVSVRPLFSKRVESVGGTSSRPSPIVVSLLSSALVRPIILGKIRMGKLHTSKLDSDLLKSAGLVTSLSSLINISEFLPKEIHLLRTLVRQKAKEKGFKTFLKNGEIHARWRDGDVISSSEDLDCFLDLK